MSENILVNYNELLESANGQVSVANDFSGAVSNIYSAIETIHQCWVGCSADAFYESTNSYKSKLYILGECIDKHGKDDIKSVGNFQDADQESTSGINSLI